MTKKSKKYNNNNLSVSLLTITQNSRFNCILILIDIIKNQTYKNIIEWIIVEGSKTQLDADNNEKNIKNIITKLQSEVKFSIHYIKKKSDIKLGELRNIGNNICKGDITVCMDDDDYYFPNRVKHAVSILSSSKCKIAGCSNHLMYDYNFNMFIQLKKFKLNHSSNCCMAWKKDYLLTNKHDSNADFAEESSFTKNFTEELAELDPFQTIILSSHTLNTFSKKDILIKYVNNIDSLVDKIIAKSIDTFIPLDILNKYKNIFINYNDNIYDIVYMCGNLSINWDPSDNSLGGSEQAVVNLSENWIKKGKSVVVYGNIPNKILNGVLYKPWYQFNYNCKYKNLILWRIYGILSICPFNVKADKIIFDIHDNFSLNVKNIYQKYFEYANNIFVKSNYHKECFTKILNNNYNNNIIIIPNGVKIEQFSKCPDNNIQRNPYRFCYCSCYKRGLDIIITKIWSIIYSYEPRAELHVYYGMNNISDKNYINYLTFLLAQPGVMDHGRQQIDLIIREKYLSTFHLYLSNSISEIDCISIKESIVAGCIPIISNFGVFKERPGFHLDINNDKEIKMAAINIIKLLKNPDIVEEYRKKIKLFNNDFDSNIIADWEKISFLWLDYFI